MFGGCSKSREGVAESPTPRYRHRPNEDRRKAEMPGPRQHVIGYGRVSTEEQESNYSMDAQRSRFEMLCKQNRWQSLGFFPETGSGTSVINRPVLCNILQRIQGGGVA